MGICLSIFIAISISILYRLQPKMILFQTTDQFDELSLMLVGIVLLLMLVFYTLSILRTFMHIKHAAKVHAFDVVMLLLGILSLLFVFSDHALLTDIHKQYKLGLGQPEWSLVYPLIGFQLVTAIWFTYLHGSRFRGASKGINVAKDSNVFLVVQYVGALCGLLGLASISLGFAYATSWSLDIHTTLGSIILLLPYALSIGYWFAMNARERSGELWDEKQMRDVGRSSFLTLLATVAFVLTLFIVNYHALDGVVSILWPSLIVFYILLIFSLGNIYFLKRD